MNRRRSEPSSKSLLSELLTSKAEKEDKNRMGHSISCIPMSRRSKKERRPTVCITARSSTTLDAVNNLVKATLGEGVNIHKILIQRRESILQLKKTVGSKTYFICCAEYGHRLLLLSDTDPDALTEVVHHATKTSKYKEDGVMVLLFDHRNLTEGIYDTSTFDAGFMQSQPRLNDKATRRLFISTKDAFNGDQMECLLRWVDVEVDHPAETVGESVETAEESAITLERSAESVEKLDETVNSAQPVKISGKMWTLSSEFDDPRYSTDV